MIWRSCRRYVLHLILVFIVVDHWLGLIMKRLQANLDGLGVVVNSTRHLASIDQPFGHRLVIGVYVQHELTRHNLNRTQRLLNSSTIVIKPVILRHISSKIQPKPINIYIFGISLSRAF